MFNHVQISPWPFLISFGLMSLLSSILLWWKMKSLLMVTMPFLIVLFTSFLWWRDVIREATFLGMHTSLMQKLIKMSMVLLIFSEIMFFMSFFWAFLHYSLSPSLELGMQWPPMAVKPLNPFQIPFLNTLILVSSGVTVTWSHLATWEKEDSKILLGLSMTIFLGVYFSYLQLQEYKQTKFSISDSAYGSIFFVSTGFHGLHVIVGSIFLFVCLFRIYEYQMSPIHFIGFELSIWYWHFVDVVWLFLFSLIYWWGG